MSSEPKKSFAIATRVGRLSSVGLMAVRVTLSLGAAGVADAACVPATDGVGDAAGALAHAVMTTEDTTSATRHPLIPVDPLSAKCRLRPPAEEPPFETLGDLDQCYGEDHEDQQDQVHTLCVEEPGGDREAVPQSRLRADELPHDGTGERERDARAEPREDPAEDRRQHHEAPEAPPRAPPHPPP